MGTKRGDNSTIFSPWVTMFIAKKKNPTLKSKIEQALFFDLSVYIQNTLIFCYALSKISLRNTSNMLNNITQSNSYFLCVM